jgi:hypothetical protein
MRKFLGGTGGGGGQPPDSGGGAAGGPEPPYRPEQELLGLNHLRKLYSEYSTPSHPLSTPEREARLYAMLPLFCKIFNSVPAKMIAERFPDTPSFAQACSKLLVTEVSWVLLQTSLGFAKQCCLPLMNFFSDPDPTFPIDLDPA